jgi:hypothetical protein
MGIGLFVLLTGRDELPGPGRIGRETDWSDCTIAVPAFLTMV